jgi:site-specific recombinase XerD
VPGHRKFEERKQQLTGRNDVKRTLGRWKHPNTQANRHAILQRFYDWCMEEGYRKDNPARQVTRARKRKAQVYRMTQDEVRAFLEAAKSQREKRVAYLGVCFGFRNAELRSLQVQNFMREGMVEIIGKGSKYRQLPMVEDAIPIVESILKGDPDDYVIPAQRNRKPGHDAQAVARTPRHAGRTSRSNRPVASRSGASSRASRAAPASARTSTRT